MAARRKPTPTPKSKASDLAFASKRDRLLAAMALCNRALKDEGRLYLGSDHPLHQRLPTGILALDYVTGGGVVRGQMCEFAGQEGSAKTLAATIAVATTQAAGGEACWCQGETFDSAWAEEHEVDLETLVMLEAASGDTAMETFCTLLDQNVLDIAVLDSFQSLGTTREFEAGVESESYAGAGAPQMWGRTMRRAYRAANRGSPTAIIGISQVRDTIGGFAPGGRKPEPKGTAIRAIKHWKAIGVYFKSGDQEYDGKEESKNLRAIEFKVRCTKNKTAATLGRYATFWLRKDRYGWAIDNDSSLVQLAVNFDLVKKKGGWYVGYGVRGQGRAGWLAAVKKRQDKYDRLVKEVRSNF